MNAYQQSRWQRPVMLAVLALALWSPSAQAENLEGRLERAASHSVLWFVSLESGDLIGQVFTNTSQAGQIILANCLPGLACVVEGASAVEPDEQLLKELHFEDQPSGWWYIQQAQNATMQASLPMSERELRTRFGSLNITEDRWLLFTGSPVLASPPQAAPTAAATSAASSAQPTRLSRIQTWWDTLWIKLRHQLLALFGHAPASSADKAQAQAAPEAAPSAAHQPVGTAEVVQGNNALDLVAHFELEERDIVLLQDTGGAGCPALYRFATLTPQGIAVTPEFGTCSGIATVTLQAAGGGTREPLITMTGSQGPHEPLLDQQRALMRLHRFTLRQGQVLDLDSGSQP